MVIHLLSSMGGSEKERLVLLIKAWKSADSSKKICKTLKTVLIMSALYLVQSYCKVLRI